MAILEQVLESISPKEYPSLRILSKIEKIIIAINFSDLISDSMATIYSQVNLDKLDQMPDSHPFPV